MSRKIKGKEKTQLSNKGIVICQNDKSLPLFSFAHLTTVKDYNFDYFGNNLREELDVRKSLDTLLKEISCTPWLELRNRGRYKFGGCEKIDFAAIKFSPKKLALLDDANIFSFRFGSRDAYRMLALKKEGCPALYIIGYDFRHNAYDHG